MAKRYDEKPLDKWNTRDFQQYMSDRHEELFGIPYVPQGGWQQDAGMLGNAIGTKVKPAKYDKAVIKRFIDTCMETYHPSDRYPGINFWFMWTYRPYDLQRAILEINREKAAEAQGDDDLDGVEDWL